MKRRLFLTISVALFGLLVGCASMTSVPPDKRNYQEIVDVTGTKGQLYTATLEWMARAFRSSQDVIQFKDADVGKIIGKGVTPDGYHFTLTTEVKDRKARFYFDQVYVEYHAALLPPSAPMDNMQMLNAFTKDARSMVADWKRYVQSPANSDW